MASAMIATTLTPRSSMRSGAWGGSPTRSRATASRCRWEGAPSKERESGGREKNPRRLPRVAGKQAVFVCLSAAAAERGEPGHADQSDRAGRGDDLGRHTDSAIGERGGEERVSAEYQLHERTSVFSGG